MPPLNPADGKKLAFAFKARKAAYKPALEHGNDAVVGTGRLLDLGIPCFTSCQMLGSWMFDEVLV